MSSSRPPWGSVERVDNGADGRIPAGPAVAALSALSVGGANLHAVPRGRVRGHFGSVGELRRSRRFHHRGRHADDKVSRERPVGPKVGPDDPVLAGRNPVRDIRRAFGNLHDIPKMIQALQVAAIVPPKHALPLAGKHADERRHPTGIGERSVPPFHRGNNDREVVAPPVGVALGAGRSRHLPESRSDAATPSVEAIGLARHLARAGQTADDREQVGGTGRNGRIGGMDRDRIGGEGELGKAEHGGILVEAGTLVKPSEYDCELVWTACG